ncbi:MAG: helix-turn-helix domain-containing protein [Alphaproteobacteria bacterium]
MPTIEQIRAARALLDWSQNDLAEEAGLSQTGIARIENGTNKPNSSTLAKIEAAFDRAHVEFIGRSGVKQNLDIVRIYEGDDCYLRFLDDAFITLSEEGGEILFSASDESRSSRFVIEKFRAMRKSGIRMRSLVQDQDTFLMGPLEEYRWMDKALFVDGDVKVIFGKRVGYLMTWRGTPRVVSIEDETIAEENRRIFNFIWNISCVPTHTTSDTFYDA